MSIRAVSMVLGLGPEVKGARRLILVALADNMNDDGWAWPKRETIADKAGIERLETVTEHLSWLEREGWIERHVNAWKGVMGEIPKDHRPNVYRFTPKLTQYQRAPRNPGRGGYTESGEGGLPGFRGGESPRRTVTENQTSPTPPQAEGALVQPGLFGPGDGGAVTARERKRRAGGQATTMIEGAYRAWLERWAKGNRGSIPAGLRAWSKAIAAGATMEELDRQSTNYQAARVAYHEAWKHVGDYWPSLMNVSTFLNGKRLMFDQPWGPDELTYWPAPAGWSWQDRGVTSHDAGDDVPAEVRAEGAVAVAMWRSKQRKLAEGAAAHG